ncbi:MAG: tyrosinase family protein [Gemmatimonadaceae bacterium]
MTRAGVSRLSALCGGPVLFVRREAWALQGALPFDAITLAYARAIRAMQARPASDPTSWTYQAAMHGSYAAPPPGATWNACQHRSWFFLPWHRMYLYYFERIVRKAVVDVGGPADFALPYWNYDTPAPGNTLPPAFVTPTLPDGTANPLFLPPPRRSAALMGGGQVPSTATSSTAAMSLSNFSAAAGFPSFGGGRAGPVHIGNAIGALESTPHNVMHSLIGGGAQGGGPCQDGLMADANCAALDPIFWLHHANIDRLWSRWLGLGGGRANPGDAAWLTQTFVFFDETGARVTLSGADVVDAAAQLGYVYDDVPVPSPRILIMASVPPPRPPELAAASEEPLELVGTRASVQLTVPRSARSMVAAAGDAESRVLVSVDDIEAERDPGVAYALYLDVRGDPGQERRQHVGNVSLFGIESADDPDRAHEGAPGFRYVFDATDAVRRLRDQHLWDPDSVTVTFEPIRILPPPGAAPAPEAEAEAAAPVAPVRIGRVALFVA